MDNIGINMSRFLIPNQAAKYLCGDSFQAIRKEAIRSGSATFLLPTGAKLFCLSNNGDILQWGIYGYACAGQDTAQYVKYALPA